MLLERPFCESTFARAHSFLIIIYINIHILCALADRYHAWAAKGYSEEWIPAALSSPAGAIVGAVSSIYVGVLCSFFARDTG